MKIPLYYNPTNKYFNKEYRSILCKLDCASFIEALRLEVKITSEVDIQDLQEKIERNVKLYTSRVMIHHIPYELKLVGEIPKKVDKMLLVEKFKIYIQNTIYGSHKMLGRNGSNMVYQGLYLMDLNIHDLLKNIKYDFLKYIIEMMQEQIATS